MTTSIHTRKPSRRIGSSRIAGICIATALAFAVAPVSAAMETPPSAPTTPKPTPQPTAAKCTNFTKGSTKWKACMKGKTTSLNDEQRYYEGYRLAKAGEYAAAIDMLSGATNRDDPRILNMIGYSTRKLGDVDAAIPYYLKALTLDPNYHVAREYLGEGYLQKGDLKSALGQLQEIADRCGTACEAYSELSQEVENYKKANQL